MLHGVAFWEDVVTDQFFTLKPRLFSPFDVCGHWADNGTGAGAECCAGASEESYFGDHLSYDCGRRNYV